VVGRAKMDVASQLSFFRKGCQLFG